MDLDKENFYVYTYLINKKIRKVPNKMEFLLKVIMVRLEQINL